MGSSNRRILASESNQSSSLNSSHCMLGKVHDTFCNGEVSSGHGEDQSFLILYTTADKKNQSDTSVVTARKTKKLVPMVAAS
jgi:hypothetical protein